MNEEQYWQWTRLALRFDDLPEHLIAVRTLEIEFLVIDRVELGERIGPATGRDGGNRLFVPAIAAGQAGLARRIAQFRAAIGAGKVRRRGDGHG